MSTLATALRALRRDSRRVLAISIPASILCIAAGVALLAVLPLNDHSRNTYVSENALLPGQVHTYFDGSEHNIFRAQRHEVHALVGKSSEERNERLGEIFRSFGLKVATQDYHYETVSANASGQNVYAVLRGPRADATEAIVLIASWKNMNEEENQSAVALVLTLARYFKRWSLWSKDIIFLIPEDSVAGPQAWVDAYHDAHDPKFVQSLKIKSGSLQGAIALDYPAGPWGQRFDKLHIIYDGINGQLPNLDLFNTVVSIASGQMNIGCTLQRMWHHGDSYKERLTTLTRGMINQALGHSTGPHSGFMRYHVDALTLQTVGDGWHDEMSLGKTTEGIFRSLNNLLEHLHQSFFFYLLMQANRFVSIGTYLPSAMAIAASFSIMSIALWFQTGFRNATPLSMAADSKVAPMTSDADNRESKGSEPLAVPDAPSPVERHMFFPLILLTVIHFVGLLPLSLFNHMPSKSLTQIFMVFSSATLPLPAIMALALPKVMSRKPTEQEITLLHCFCLLMLGMVLAALATVNYSLSYIVGALCTPLVFVRLPTHLSLGSASQTTSSSLDIDAVSQLDKPTVSVARRIGQIILAIVHLAVSPPAVIYGASTLVPGGLDKVLAEAAFGWCVYGLWTQVIIWLVWWPAWCAGGYVLWAQMV